METKYGDLQIEEDMRFQERTWKAQRVGWAQGFVQREQERVEFRQYVYP